MRRILIPALVGLALTPTASAVAAGPKETASPFAVSIPVRLSMQGQVLAPANVTPGDQLIANRSSQELVVVARRALGARRLVADLRRSRGPILSGALAHDFTVVDTLTPHAHVYTVLRRGAYLIARRHAGAETAKDVATVRAAGSGPGAAVPAAASIVRFTRNDHLAMTNPTYAMSALYLRNDGTCTVQIRFYRLAATEPAGQLATFTSHPSWSRLQQLQVSHATDLATMAPGRWITDGDLPAGGRYLTIAVPLLPRSDHRPALRPAWVAAVRVVS